MKVIPELKETLVKTQFVPQDQRTKIGRNVGTVRVDIKNVEQLRHVAESREFKYEIDEPPERGGTNAGLNPLGFFLIGAASCFLNQLVKVAIVEDLKLDNMEVTARGHYNLHTGGGIYEFTDIVYDVKMDGSESKESLEELLKKGEDRCFVHNTLKKAIPLTTNISLNGKPLLSHTVGPNTF